MSPFALSLRLLQTQTDERLVQLARSGHEPAFEALVRRYRRPLLEYCRRLGIPDASAEDILQQALLQAWRALAAGAEVRDPRAWLYRIVHNVAISTSKRPPRGRPELGELHQSAGVEQVVEQRLAARDALAGLAALPELQRQVLLGTAVEGRSHEEVAGALGLTTGSVRGLIYRARAALRSAAAALIPGPLLNWALARGYAPQSSTLSDAITAGGSAGVAGAVLKGGAIVTVAGALAGTAAIITSHPQHPPPRTQVALARPRIGRGTDHPRRNASAAVIEAAAVAPPRGTATRKPGVNGRGSRTAAVSLRQATLPSARIRVGPRTELEPGDRGERIPASKRYNDSPAEDDAAVWNDGEGASSGTLGTTTPVAGAGPTATGADPTESSTTGAAGAGSSGTSTTSTTPTRDE